LRGVRKSRRVFFARRLNKTIFHVVGNVYRLPLWWKAFFCLDLGERLEEQHRLPYNAAFLCSLNYFGWGGSAKQN
jgi:hypothetical protein